MKFKAILFMFNDFDRAEFVLSNFTKHHPDTPIRIINSGGETPQLVKQASYIRLNNVDNIEIINAPNLWYGRSFDNRFFDYLFDYGLDEAYTHMLYLETDVYTLRPITLEPEYDMAGIITGNGPGEQFLYEELDLGWPHYHSGAGGTMFSLNYFQTIKKDFYHLYKELYEKYPNNYFQDMIGTLVSRLSGCTFGRWPDVQNMPCDVDEADCALLHNYKI